MKNQNKFYMGVAHEIATASRAKVRRVGAVLVRDNNILSFGYNGTPKGFSNMCELDTGMTKPEVLHAESNAISKCAQSTQSSTNSTLYVTTAPCFECAKLIIQSGIIRVIYDDDYRNEDGIKLLAEAGIAIEKINHGEN